MKQSLHNGKKKKNQELFSFEREIHAYIKQ